MKTKCSQLRDDFTPDRVIVDYPYPRGLRDDYCKGKVVQGWLSKYQGKWPFHECLRDKSKADAFERSQIPFRPGDLCGFFSELYVANQYLDAKYEAYLFYRHWNEKGGGESYDEATKLLGGSDVLGEKGAAPPDLLVFSGNSFRFVECKRAGEDDEFTDGQPARFHAIENWLNSNKHLRSCQEPLCDPGSPKLFPDLPKDHWIHVVCLVEE